MKYPLRDYQTQGIADLGTAMRSGHSRILLTMPTGTGKMVVASEICARAARKGSVVIFAVHRRELVKQCSEKLTEMNVRHGLILPGENYSNVEFCYAGSIQSIIAQGRRGKFDPSRVDVIIYDECFPAGTLVDGRPIETLMPGMMVRSFNHSTREVELRPIVRLFKNPVKQLARLHLSDQTQIVCTPSHPFAAKKHGEIGTALDYLPAHQMTGHEVVKINKVDSAESDQAPVRVKRVEIFEVDGDNDFGGFGGFVYNFEVERNHNYFVDDVLVHNCHHHKDKEGMYADLVKLYPKAKVIGLTATPTRSDGRGLGNFYTNLVQPITYAQAFERGYLVKPKYFSHYLPEVAQGLEGIKSGADGDYNEADLERIMNKKEIIGDVVEHAARHGSDLQGIVFATRVAHSVALRDAFNSVGMTAFHIDGKTPQEERDELMTAFRNNEIQVLTNVGIAGEGFDIPNVGFVSLVRPTKSIIYHLQTVGRGLRPAAGKTQCLILDHAGNTIRMGRAEDYEEWTLETSKMANAKKVKEKDPKEAPEITCEDCGLIFSSSKVCPHCEHVHEWETIPEDLIVVPGELAEYHGKKAKQKKITYTMEEKQQWYSQLFQYWLSTNYNQHWVGNQYKEKFGIYPRGLKKVGRIMTPEVAAFIEAGKRNYRAKMQAEKDLLLEQAEQTRPVRPAELVSQPTQTTTTPSTRSLEWDSLSRI